ncbi:MAG TPA: hypothetical protein VJ885_18375 [Thermoanaerobaculia bacterium]|nr:hypothetical protein [Thermoanaerobaculia bacterium]
MADRVETSMVIGADDIRRTVEALTARHGAEHAGRIRRGVEQVAQRWWAEDGDAATFAAFCEQSFVAGPEQLAAVFRRLQDVQEQVDGHVHEIRREVMFPVEVDTGDLSPLDQLLADFDLAPQIDENLFKTKVAFLALLNFPVHSLAERLEQGGGWSREEWARSRMTDRFASRVPAAIAQEVTRVANAAERYVSGYNIRVDRLVLDEGGERLFPEGLRLISHWGLRDELASHYVTPDGLTRQRAILRVMERIVRQEIPAAVVDNPRLTWNPFTNEVRPVAGEDAVGGGLAGDLAAREPDTRYAHLLDYFRAVRPIDQYSPAAPNFIQRRFERDRQMPEAEVEELLISVLESREVHDLGQRIAERVGRPLEPFDIWYSGFKSRGSWSEQELDRIVREKFPTLEAFKAGMPEVLEAMGFTPEKASWLAEHIAVDPARGAGHALGAVRRQDKTHLRTRVPRGGMDYKGYNVALHELGHNVEEVFSLNGIDQWWLAGVPNNAFTEAFAFICQHRDLELLGLGESGEEARHVEALGTLWNTYEISGVSLVDLWVWRWMYEHPEATPAELREAALAIARDVWNRWFAPVFGVRDSDILAIYSHMIVYGLYLPDYAIGHIIAFQLASYMTPETFGADFERMARQGRLTPEAWIRGAVGGPVSAQALLAASREALEKVRD